MEREVYKMEHLNSITDFLEIYNYSLLQTSEEYDPTRRTISSWKPN